MCGTKNICLFDVFEKYTFHVLLLLNGDIANNLSYLVVYQTKCYLEIYLSKLGDQETLNKRELLAALSVILCSTYKFKLFDNYSLLMLKDCFSSSKCFISF